MSDEEWDNRARVMITRCMFTLGEGEHAGGQDCLIAYAQKISRTRLAYNTVGMHMCVL